MRSPVVPGGGDLMCLSSAGSVLFAVGPGSCGVGGKVVRLIGLGARDGGYAASGMGHGAFSLRHSEVLASGSSVGGEGRVRAESIYLPHSSRVAQPLTG